MVHHSDGGGYPVLLTDKQLESSRQNIKAKLRERHRAEMVERAAKHDQRALDEWIDWVLNRWVLETTGAAHQALYCSSWDQWISLYPLPLPSVEFCHMVLGQLMTFDTPDSAWEEARRIDPLLWDKANRQDPTGEKFLAHLPAWPLIIDDINVIQVKEILGMEPTCQCGEHDVD